MDTNLQIPLSTITTTLSRHAKRAVTNTEKKYLHALTEDIGTAISQKSQGFNVQEFEKACGVSPEWGQVAA